MNYRTGHIFLIISWRMLILLMALAPHLGWGQAAEEATAVEAQPSDRVRVFLNCRSCDQTFIRTEIEYIDFVRDQDLADLQIFVNRISNASGGSTYELKFTGYNRFESMGHKLEYVTNPILTNDEIRSGLLKRIEAGLMVYVAQTSLADEISISVPTNPKVNRAPTPERDPWNNWVFRVYGDGRFDQEAQRSTIDLEFGIAADRVTEDWRINLRGELNHFQRKFVVEEEEILNFRDRNFGFARVVKSISRHWSVGTFMRAEHNTYANIQFAASVFPAIEYSLFPYSDVAKREITLAYHVGYRYNDYMEETIYGKTEEHLARQLLRLRARFNQPWGLIFASLEGYTFLHDFSKRSLELDSYVSIRLLKGLAARLSADMQIIHDQINLPRNDASLEDILLAQRQLATNFEMGIGVGLSYTFGSAYNNVVNTRL